MPLLLLSQFDNAKVRKIQIQNNSFPRLFFIKSKIFFRLLRRCCTVAQLRSCIWYRQRSLKKLFVILYILYIIIYNIYKYYIEILVSYNRASQIPNATVQLRNRITAWLFSYLCDRNREDTHARHKKD